MMIFHSDVKLSEGHTGDVPNVVLMLFVEVIINTKLHSNQIPSSSIQF